MKSRRDFLKGVVAGSLGLAALSDMVSVEAVPLEFSSRVECAEESNAEPLSVKDLDVNGVRVRILGVRHTGESLSERCEMFKDHVSSHQTLLLEQPVNSEFWQDEFFGGISDYAWEQGKTVYQADPVNIELDNVDKLLFYGGLGAIAFAGIDTIRANPKLDRRQFLRKATIAGAGGYAAFGSFYGYIFRVIARGDDTAFNFTPDDFALLGTTDYRNVRIAEGIDFLTKSAKGLKSMVSIHGAAHSQPIITYLENPALRAKRLAYAPFDFIGKSGIREFYPTEDGWKLNAVY